MSTVTEYDAASRSSSLNQETYPSNSFSPAVGDLPVVFVISSGTVDAGAISASANGISSFVSAGRATFGPTVHSVYMFIGEQLATGTAAMTVTFDCTGDPATGALVFACGVSGMTKVGAAAIRQVDLLDNGAGATQPQFVLPAPALSSNVTLYALGEISSAGILTPTGWTQGAWDTFSTPTIGGGYGYRNSGFSGTTVNWPGNETAHGGIFVELDTSSDAVVEQSNGPGFPI